MQSSANNFANVSRLVPLRLWDSCPGAQIDQEVTDLAKINRARQYSIRVSKVWTMPCQVSSDYLTESISEGIF